jgi:hypothetical protein
MVNTSFFTDGGVYDEASVTSNDVPSSSGTTSAPSSLYPNGGIYDVLSENGVFLGQVQALAAQAAASASAGSTSASSAAASAASAASSLASIGTTISGYLGTANPLAPGTASPGVSTTKFSREDHVHPTDTTRASVTYVDTQDATKADAAATTAALALKAPLASPALSGTPTSTTPTAGDNTTKIATTAFVAASFAPLASPTFTGTPKSAPASGDAFFNLYAPGTTTNQAGINLFDNGVGGTNKWQITKDTANNFNINDIAGGVAVLQGTSGSGFLRSITRGALDNSTALATTAYVDRTTREKLTANRTYYVRSDGSDSNTGLVNSAGGAFLTAQAAVNKCVTLDLAGFNITIQMVNVTTPQTYTGTVTVSVPFLGGVVTLQGDNTTPSNLVWSTGGSNGITVSGRGCRLDVSGFKMTTSSGGAAALLASDGGLLRIVNRFEFGAVSGACMQAQTAGEIQNFASAAGTTPHMKMTGNIGNLASAQSGGIVLHDNVTTDIAAGLTCVNFLASFVAGYIQHVGDTYTTSTFTGPKGIAQSNAIVDLGGGATTAIPASGTFTTSTGGINI